MFVIFAFQQLKQFQQKSGRSPGNSPAQSKTPVSKNNNKDSSSSSSSSKKAKTVDSVANPETTEVFVHYDLGK